MIGDGNFISQVPLFGGLDDAQQVRHSSTKAISAIACTS